MFLRLGSVLSLLSAASLALGATIPIKRATVCNGRAELCNRSYGNITFIGSHDSFAFSADPLALARDQKLDIPSQLKLGVRLLQAQSHVKDGQLHFCHTSCDLFDGGLVLDYLKNVKSFLDANPNEVLTLIFTNPEGQSPAKIWKPIFDQAGITPLAFVPPHIPMKRSEWPTLGQMIDSGKRVVVFLDANADPGPDAVDFIMPEFQMIWETPFSVTDPNFPCKVDRIGGPLSADDHMYMINHSLNKEIKLPFVDPIVVSDPLDADKVNSPDSIMANVQGCAAVSGGHNPNFVLLDFVHQGNPFQAADKLNGFA